MTDYAAQAAAAPALFDRVIGLALADGAKALAKGDITRWLACMDAARMTARAAQRLQQDLGGVTERQGARNLDPGHARREAKPARCDNDRAI